MEYHSDQFVNRAMIGLADALTMHERVTGQKSTLVLVPASGDNVTILASGKPLNETGPTDVALALTTAYQDRGDPPEISGKFMMVATHLAHGI